MGVNKKVHQIVNNNYQHVSLNLVALEEIDFQSGTENVVQNCDSINVARELALISLLVQNATSITNLIA